MPVAKQQLVIWTLSAIFFVWVIATINGVSFGLITTSWTGFFPGSSDAIRPSFTGIPGLDFVIKINVSFFAPAFDERNWGLQLFFIDFMASMEAVSMVMSIEGLRYGNQDTSIARPSLWTMGSMVVSAAVLFPTYFYKCLRHWSFIPSNNVDFYGIPGSQALALVPSHLIGNIVPLVLVELPPKFIDMQTRHLLVFVWLFAAVWTSVIHRALAYLFDKCGAGDSNMLSQRYPIKSLRLAYVFAATLSLTTHLFTIRHALQSQHDQLTLSSLFLPRLFVTQFPEGVFGFLQWDYLFLYSSSIAWAYYSWRQVTGWESSSWRILVVIFFSSFFLSPGSVIAGIMWLREESIYQKWSASRGNQVKKSR